ncbi:MAG: GDP-L-fucose synthase [Alphaproteobacteria bacterium]|nr:MAG: GDP-L-fucose synthase [Alphaproteobacteria bacterium]
MTPPIYDLAGKRVVVAGHRGMVGAATARRLATEGCTVIPMGRDQVDLRRQAEVDEFLKDTKADALVLAAAKVGGIMANATYPADFLYDNLAIETNIIHGAHLAGIGKLLFLGSSCIYPKLAPQPMTEDALLTGPLEPTNEWYAIAKIAGIKLCQAYRAQYGADYISAMPTNLYGPGDNYNLESSHVIPALIRKAHMARESGAKSMEIWGTGTPLREFLHADDCADALVHLLKHYSDAPHVNVGSGSEITIGDLARMVMEVVGFKGDLVCDTTKPDGTPRKLMDGARLAAMGWQPKIGLREGLAHAYRCFLEEQGRR